MARYRLERHITDQLIENAIIDVLPVIRREMKEVFNRLVLDAQLPANARPVWCLSWECEADRPDNVKEEK